MDLTSTAVLNLTVYQYKSVIDGIFRLNTILHNTCQLQCLAKLDKFVFNSDLQFIFLFLKLPPAGVSSVIVILLILWGILKCLLLIFFKKVVF